MAWEVVAARHRRRRAAIQSGSVFVLDGEWRSRARADVAHASPICRKDWARIFMPTSVFARISILRPPVRTISRGNATGESPSFSRAPDLTLSDRPAKKLSGGMRQKLGLCCALIHDPDLLILDEPTTGVDPLSRRQFWELIDRMRRAAQGMSLLIATAYMEEAERFDWLVAMNAGKVSGNRHAAELKARLVRRRSRTRSSRCFPKSSLAVTTGSRYRRVASSTPSRSSLRATSPVGSATSPRSTG